MILPGFLYFVVFRYAPMGGIAIAFQDYNPFLGFFQSEWVGFDQFRRLFNDPTFYHLVYNTVYLNLSNLIWFFPAPIILAILFNEIRMKWFRKTGQTIAYIPHFLSWVVVVSITVLLFSAQEGGVNVLLQQWGFGKWNILTNPDTFISMYISQTFWKESGWSAIIFLATLASIDPTLYEAAVVDGAGRWRQLWHITLPALKSTIFIMLILRIGYVMEADFEHILLMQNASVMEVSDVINTYVYRVGILQQDFSYNTAVALFKSAIGLILVVLVNRLAKRFGEEGVY
jgi:putative aldouronate transport system permease protein